MKRLRLVCTALYPVAVVLVLLGGLHLFGSVNEGLLPPQIPAANESYRAYLSVSVAILAVILGVVTGLVTGPALGVGGLLVGIGFTAAVLAPLPRVYHPGIDFTAWLTWIATGVPIAVAVHLALVLARFLLRTMSAADG